MCSAVARWVRRALDSGLKEYFEGIGPVALISLGKPCSWYATSCEVKAVSATKVTHKGILVSYPGYSGTW